MTTASPSALVSLRASSPATGLSSAVNGSRPAAALWFLLLPMLALGGCGAPPEDETGEEALQRGRNPAFEIPAMTFYAQNMGLLPDAPPFVEDPYQGIDRIAALHALLGYLHRTKPDVVGLSEVFREDEREWIRKAMASVYPPENSMDGPNENDLEDDGGLLLLSKYPIVARNATIYRVCKGFDCLTNKGILHARLRTPSGDVDVFHSHLQSATRDASGGNPDVGPFSTERDKVRYQLSVLGDFIKSTRDFHIPAVVMGDLNADAGDGALYSQLMAQLEGATDVWRHVHGDEPGLTWDDVSTFRGDRGTTAADDPSRGQHGERLDYILALQGTRQRVDFSQMWVVRHQTDAGHDMSDHYGVLAGVRSMGQLWEPAGTVARVRLQLYRFHCLLETKGITGQASNLLGNTDEVTFQMRADAGAGARTTGVTQKYTGLDRGGKRFIDRVLSFDNPTAGVTITVDGWELDDGPFGIGSTQTSLGSPSITLSQQDLIDRIGGPERELGFRLTGASGEYIATVRVAVE